MKFRVDRDALGEAVAWVARALPTRPVVPVLSGLLLQASQHGQDGAARDRLARDRLTLSCFDYEVAARIQIDAEVAEPGTVLVPGRLLAEITRNLPQEPAEFGTDAEMVSLTCGSAEFALVCLPEHEYPALPDPPPPAGTIDGGVLAIAAAQVVPSASRDDTLPMLTAVCLQIDGPTMTLAATDRYRLAVSEVSWAPTRPDIKASILVPARTLADVARALAPGEPVTLSFDATDADERPADVSARRPVGEEAPPATDASPATGHRPASVSPASDHPPANGMITFTGAGRRLTTRLIAGDFVRYQSRFPAAFGCAAELPAGRFIEAVRRVSLVADRASPLRLAFRPGGVIIEAHAEGRARALESVPAQFVGAEPVISFNPHYLLDGLTAAALPTATQTGASRRSAGPADGEATAPAEAGRIRLEFTSPTRPALITWTDGRGPSVAGDIAARSGAARAESGAGKPPRDPVPSAPSSSFRYLLVPLRSPERP